VEPSLVSRIWDYAVVLLVNWKGAVATVCLIVLTLPQLLNEPRRSALDGQISPERRRKLLVAAAAACLLFASFQAYDDLSAKNRALAQELASRGPSQRTITEVTVNPYRVKETDDYLNVILLPTQIILPLTFPRGKTITVKDKAGASASSPIVITADQGAKIDGLPQVSIRGNFGASGFLWDGKGWSIY
jgi:hypothetical protein